MSVVPLLDTTSRRLRPGSGFTLVELLVVIAVIVLLLGLIVPAFTSVNTGRQITLAAYNVEGLLDTARAYAKANDTYTWVGFYEENGSRGSTTPATAGSGRVVISVVASKDGTSVGTAPLDSDATRLTQINKLVKLDNTHLAELTTSDTVTRAPVASAYQVGNDGFSQTTKFHYPLGASDAVAAYTFVKIIRFSPIGDAQALQFDSPVQLLEIGLRPARGATPDTTTKNCAAIQVTGIDGAVRIYQP